VDAVVNKVVTENARTIGNELKTKMRVGKTVSPWVSRAGSRISKRNTKASILQDQVQSSQNVATEDPILKQLFSAKEIKDRVDLALCLEIIVSKNVKEVKIKIYKYIN
jgi:hypothetical protein